MCNEVRNWYFDDIPVNSHEYTKFLSNAKELGHKDVKEYKTTLAKHPIPGKGTARIPSWALDEDILPEQMSTKDKRALQTAFWNHAVLMNKGMYGSPEEYHRGNYGTSLSQYLSIMDYILNLNANEKLQRSVYKPFTIATNNFMYSKGTLMTAVEEVIAAQTMDMDNSLQIGEVLEHYLNADLREDVRAIVGDEIADVLDKVVNYTGQTNKGLARLSNILYELLHNTDNEESPTPQVGDDSSEGNGEEDQDSGDKGEEENQQDFDSNGEAAEKEENQEQSSEGPAAWRDENKNIEPETSATEFGQTTPEMSEAIEEMNEAIAQAGWDKSANEAPTIRVLDVLRTRPNVTIKASDTFNTMGKLIRQIKVKRYIPTDPQLYGGELLEDQLFRVVTDHKVMGTLEEHNRPIRKEFKIVCDLSGSTNRPTKVYPYTNRGELLWYTELAAAKGAFTSLREARENVAVYGHTTDGGYGNVYPVLYKIANDRDMNIEERFNAASGVYRNSNYDDMIISHIAQHEFNYPDSIKFILMLSDGRPCGLNGVENTRNVVNNLRKKGITIISFSLVPDVMPNNDVIYGSEWNIDASRDNLDEVLKKLFIDIAKQHKE